MSESALSLEAQSAWVLFLRERGATSVARLAAAAQLPFELAELLLCRGLATLVQRGYPAAQLCAVFSLRPDQLARAAKARPFGEAFEPLGEQRWPSRAELPDEQAPASIIPKPAPPSAPVELQEEMRSERKNGNGAAHEAEPQRATPGAAALPSSAEPAEPETDEAALIAELASLLREEPKSQRARTSP